MGYGHSTRVLHCNPGHRYIRCPRPSCAGDEKEEDEEKRDDERKERTTTEERTIDGEEERLSYFPVASIQLKEPFCNPVGDLIYQV